MSGKTTRILVAGGRTDSEAQRRLRELAEVVYIDREFIDTDKHAERVRAAVEAYGPFVGYAEQYGPGCAPLRWHKELFGPMMPECKIFASPGVGFDNMDLPWFTKNGAFACNAPTTVRLLTADGAVMSIMNAFRGTIRHDMSVRAGKWADVTVDPLDWRGRTLGVLGLGTIGLKAATMCHYLGMKIIYHNRRPNPSAPEDFELVSQDELWKQYIVDKDAFDNMKDGVLLVNLARGPIIHEESLADALDSGKVKRAVLDVFENEPNVNPRLMTHPNTTLSPHVMYLADTSLRGVNEELIWNIVAYLETGKPNTPLNEPMAV